MTGNAIIIDPYCCETLNLLFTNNKGADQPVTSAHSDQGFVIHSLASITAKLNWKRFISNYSQTKVKCMYMLRIYHEC